MKENNLPTVYVIQEVAGTKAGNPKINIIGASNYGDFKFLLPEFSQMIFSPGPLVYKLRQGLKNFTDNYKYIVNFKSSNFKKIKSESEFTEVNLRKFKFVYAIFLIYY